MRLSRLICCGLLFIMLPALARAEQTSGMQLIILGTGYPYPAAERAGPSCAVIFGGKLYVVDAGRGTGMRLAALGNPWNSIGAALVTHLHSDHIDGLPDLFHSTWQFGGGLPFELYGPSGIQKVADAIVQFYDADIHIRRDLTEKLPPEGARINVHEIQQGVVYEKSGLKITAFEVDHQPVKPAFGYRFDAGQQSIVITGDTGPSANLIRFADGADVLVSEAYVPSTIRNEAQRLQSWSIRDYHLSAMQAGEIAQKSKVKILVLTHLMPGNAPEESFLSDAQKVYSGKVIVGRDLMKIDPSTTAGN
jgi:ribonuclease Z